MDKSNKTNLTFKNLYEPSLIEKKWQTKWLKDKLYKTQENEKNEKFYALSMFPYPSGNLHMGHVRNYVITDVIARYQKLKGKDVLHPMGWDAFGLPAENAAIERGINPEIWTKDNISHMKSQLSVLGLSVDWEKEFATCNEDYYKWTQFLFLELFKSGLVYKKKSEVNWDPIDKTVLANEQVDSEGKSWRSGATVEKKLLNQWYLKITNYAEDLLDDIRTLHGWPERVRTMQENWIGRSKGAIIKFNLEDIEEINLKVFTTRIDTLFGVTYIAVSPNHEVTSIIRDKELKDKISNFKEIFKNYDVEKEKIGFNTGLKAINPINNKAIPIWVASYVLDDYGTGAVMGVPAHDQRDYEFAEKYKIIIKKVISKDIKESNEKHKRAFEENGFLINSDNYDGISNSEAKRKFLDIAKDKGWGEEKIQYKLRDWLISRQRYWGCPIPIINCSKCGPIPVEPKDLPVKLPKEVNIVSNKINFLNQSNEWQNIKCPRCGSKSKRETDTMDTFMCSSWYFLRYPCADLNDKPFIKEKINKWLPVDQYVGGVEHAILHLLYARFLTKALKDNNLFDINEPFKKLLTQGMVQSAAYKNKNTGRYIPLNKIKDINNPIDPDDNSKLEILFEKMSKSKYNGIDPETVIKKYGADTARMFILFKAPPEKDLEWGDSDVEGQFRFLSRVWKLYYEYINDLSLEKVNIKKETHEKNILRSMNLAIKEISQDIENNQFNTAISELMKFCNAITQDFKYINSNLKKIILQNLCILLAPFSPHISEELWHLLGSNESVHLQKWPEYDSKAIILNNYELVIQINGKVRDKINLSTDASEEIIKQKSLESPIVMKWIDNKEIRKIIIVKGKIINIVV